MAVIGWGGVTLQVDISFNGSTWVDVTEWVRGMDLQKAGRDREQDRFRGGVCRLTLDNRDGRFSPFNASSPYHPNVLPRRRCRVSTTYIGVERQFIGWNEDWNETHPEKGRDNVVSVEFVDGFMLLAGVEGYALSPQGEGETLSARIDRIVTSAGSPGGITTNVRFAGNETMQSTTLARDALTEIYLAADSVGADVWMDVDGAETPRLNVWGRYARAIYSFSVNSGGTWGDGSGELPYTDIVLSTGADTMVNEAAFARTGGTAQLASNTSSIASYQRRRYGRNDLQVETDAATAALAEWTVFRFAQPDTRVASIEVRPQVAPATLWPVLNFVRLLDRYRVIRRALGGYTVDRQVFVDGVRHQVTPDQWVTTLQFCSAAPFDTLGPLMIIGTGFVVGDGKVFYP